MEVHLEKLVAMIGGYSVSIALVTFATLLILIRSTKNPKSQCSRKLPRRFHFWVPLLTGKLCIRRTGPLGMIRYAYDQLGDVFRIQLAGRGVTFLVGPDAHHAFFSANDTELSQQEVYAFTVPAFGPGIVYDAPLKTMNQQLRMLKTGLAHEMLVTYSHKIENEVRAIIEEWRVAATPNTQGSIILDIKEAMAELTVRSASKCLLGDEIRNELHHEFARYYEELNHGMTHFSVFFPRFPIKAHRKRDEARRNILSLFSRVIKRRRDDTTSVPQSDLLQVFMEAEYTDGTRLSDDHIGGLLLTALFAGQHTSNITAAWVGLLLASNPQFIIRLREEQLRVLSKHNGQLTLEALADMDFLHACVREALRLFPPLIILMRYARKAREYAGFTIPKGDIVCVSPAVSHRLPAVYTNPDSFDPDRYFAPRCEDALKFSFIAFGGGRHSCLGENFGFLQVKTIWSILIREFDLSLPDSSIPRSHLQADYSTLVAGPKPPSLICLTPVNIELPASA